MPPSITMDTVRTRDLSESDRVEIVDLCTRAHGIDFGELFSFLPPDGLHIVARADDRIVGHALVTTRWLQPGELPLLKTAYVDAVTAEPRLQNQGVGSAVMRHLAAAITDYEIACLETDRVSFYTRLRWRNGARRWRGGVATRSSPRPIR